MVVVGRRSPRRKAATKGLEVEEEEQQQAEQQEKKKVIDASEEEKVMDGPTKSSERGDTASSAKRAARSERKKRKDALRSKSMGVIEKDQLIQGKKIVFEDDFVAETNDSAEMTNHDNVSPQEEKEDDDDDQVEEVKTSVAKELALERKQQERKAASDLQKLEKNKRKRKAAVDASDDAAPPPPPMDDDFFAQVDADLEEERKVSKKGPTSLVKGKRTAFVSTVEETDDAKQVEHNIEVVVLGSASQVKAVVTGVKPSEAAMVFSRSRIEDGMSTIKKSGVSKQKPAKVDGWRRSKKMNRFLLGRKRRKKPAANFVIQA